MDQLLAWIEPRGPHDFTAAFVSKAMALRRAPATQLFGSPGEARDWIKREAEALGVSVEWIDYSPQFAKDGVYPPFVTAIGSKLSASVELCERGQPRIPPSYT